MKGIRPYLSRKLRPLEDLLQEVGSWKKKGETVGFTNGVFDILHVGHVNYLQEASEKVDHLIIGLNSDDSVRRLGKGPERPINGEEARAAVLAGLASVRRVVVFQEDTPQRVIEAISPDILFKGGDYDPEVRDPANSRYIVGSDWVLGKGGQVLSIPIVEGFSTTGTVKRMRQDGH